ncbi:ATP-binding cassette domain-containing protein [uncultured Dietzia sp.]|uniref:ATP-binding cassette domain-containing protein n=1 Tax=uncultured Dietzia sp. TaxID=395519 RepID=UPI0025FF54EA|nr:ABC transporter ATP-binding protein [uncultured Dietzia sp.]
MTTAIEVHDLTRRHRSATALDSVTVSFEAGVIHGLLGRNGAGKTSLMSIASGQDWPTSGSVTVFGEHPHENEQVLPRICFVREDQRYIEDSYARHAFAAAAMAFPRWDRQLADRLSRELGVPARTRIKKMSRGQRSAVAVIIGIASRADLTFFDEPYMGLDAVARQLFYDRLLEDYAEHPRTIVLSSHLIDEIAHLIENVVLIDRGRIMLDEQVDALRGRAVTLIGTADTVRELTDFRQVLHTESLGRLTRSTVLGALEEHEEQRARARGVEVLPVSLQQLIVHLTSGDVGGRRDEGPATAPDPTTTTSPRNWNSEVAS